jgi:uncharacterized membrane protein YdjX (TVP38/TMEM64 family)
MENHKIRNWINIFSPLFFIAIVFIIVAHYSSVYSETIRDVVIQQNSTGVFLYIFVTIIAVVIAPVSTVPLLPLASNLWGPVVAAILSIIGWVIGSMIAFFIARAYGRTIVEKFVSFEKIQKIESYIPQKNEFWSIVFLRMGVPVDILSYALGLFTSMRPSAYFFATLIGVSPFGFIFAYVGTFSVWYQVGALGVSGVIIVFSVFVLKRKGV